MIVRLDKDKQKQARRLLLNDIVYIFSHEALRKMQQDGHTELTPLEVFLSARHFYETLLANGGIYTPRHYRNRFGEEFVIAAINHISTDIHKNYDAVAKYLRTNQPGIVPQALSEIQRLYHS